MQFHSNWRRDSWRSIRGPEWRQARASLRLGRRAHKRTEQGLHGGGPKFVCILSEIIYYYDSSLTATLVMRAQGSHFTCCSLRPNFGRPLVQLSDSQRPAARPPARLPVGRPPKSIKQLDSSSCNNSLLPSPSIGRRRRRPRAPSAQVAPLCGAQICPIQAPQPMERSLARARVNQSFLLMVSARSSRFGPSEKRAPKVGA